MLKLALIGWKGMLFTGSNIGAGRPRPLGKGSQKP